MGAPVVHGVHLVLWAIDRWLASVEYPVRITALKAVFRKPVYLDREVALELKHASHQAVEFAGRCSDVGVLELAVRVDRGSRHADVDRGDWSTPTSPDVVSREAAATACGEIPIAIDDARARTLFPHLCERVGLAQLAELLATTRLVGMHCPGLHSLFSGLSLEAHQATAGRSVRYEVADAKLKYSMIPVRVNGPSLRGTLDTFYRPPPTTSVMADVVRAVARDSCVTQRALVVGGSRGLGEAFAKAIAAGGGQVCLTYHRGAGDAERVIGEIRDAGLHADAFALDVLSPSSLVTEWPLRKPPTHLYYCATPTLHSARMGATLDVGELDLLIRYFVVGLHATTQAAIALGANPIVVWTPSTTLLEAPSGAAMYCTAKAAMEEFCKHLPSLLPVTVLCPRIGRVDTDQSASLVQRQTASTLSVAIAQLSAMG